MAVALKENQPVRGVEALAERPDGRSLHPFRFRPRYEMRMAKSSGRKHAP